MPKSGTCQPENCVYPLFGRSTLNSQRKKTKAKTDSTPTLKTVPNSEDRFLYLKAGGGHLWCKTNQIWKVSNFDPCLGPQLLIVSLLCPTVVRTSQRRSSAIRPCTFRSVMQEIIRSTSKVRQRRRLTHEFHHGQKMGSWVPRIEQWSWAHYLSRIWIVFASPKWWNIWGSLDKFGELQASWGHTSYGKMRPTVSLPHFWRWASDTGRIWRARPARCFWAKVDATGSKHDFGRFAWWYE